MALLKVLDGVLRIDWKALRILVSVNERALEVSILRDPNPLAQVKN
jgi:hypothetical protein